MIRVLRNPLLSHGHLVKSSILLSASYQFNSLNHFSTNSSKFQQQQRTKNASSEPNLETDLDRLKQDDPTIPKVPVQNNLETIPKPPLMERIKHEIKHYWDGTKLLGYEVKISTKLLFKMIRGYELTRREQTQLSRTTTDIFRLVPFSAFILIPFAELLLPIALKIFPNLLPSTYESKAEKNKKNEKLLKTRTQTSSFLRQTFEESGMRLPKAVTKEERLEFIQFFRILNTLGENPTKEQVVKIARLFKNDAVLDNLSRPQLVAMAKYMNLTSFGSDQILRYQIRYRLLQIIKDDRAIDYEGVESLSKRELTSACVSRGIKTQGVSPARLKDDLKIWLDLRLRQKIPSTLLILSSVYTYGEASNNLDSYYDALVQVLRSIPDQVYNVTKSEVDDDAKLKLDIIKEQEELIKEEQEQDDESKTHVKDDIKLEDYEKDEDQQSSNENIKQNENSNEKIESKDK
ncbi:hypothetical protein BN7_3158 [Wickerhamomyces ciferrii]|uniref:Letm1 RBD domain-containing protein n=1 Tax=Wickerhamomyces ciferrii (strain ATCC 14091 / BCRC 22168 / CBS 111 / JCM 3599 / NBRC 0793 / NRRL Y-1031 F-60-10) TaxID=1206466 RepID=K0KEP3_WICCF|nr:uncharacterized protein BN7_3158 [Wickerhamomyces ciferrii]CCH43605.1 hypothetical protein BN7_3158 [Wickerhamomyces ciferrii]